MRSSVGADSLRHGGHDPQSADAAAAAAVAADAAVTVRAVVVTWNGAALLPACLDSLLGQTMPAAALEIVVVDNGSTDDTLALLASHYPSVKVLALPENIGFAGGIAAGTADLLEGAAVVEARGAGGLGLTCDYVALLNNDARFEPDAIAQLIKAITQAPNIGAATALVLLDSQAALAGDPIINSTGNILTASGAATDRDYGLPLSKLDVSPAHRQVFGFNGGAALLNVKALRQAGGFDPSLFLYYEDTDLSFRMRKAGWQVVFTPDARAWHQHMASSGGEASPIFRYYNTRNSLIIAARYLPFIALVKSVVRQTLGLIRHTLARDESLAVRSARRRGLSAGLRAIPRQYRMVI